MGSLKLPWVLVGVFYFGLCGQVRTAASETDTVPRDWHAQSVFLTPERIESLKRAVQNRQQPNYVAFEKLRKEAEAFLQYTPNPPTEWYVPGYYDDGPGHIEAKRVLQDEANGAYMLALCYRMLDNEKFARAAVRLIDAWPATVKTLRTKDDSRLSWSYHFPAFIFAADLIRESPLWPAGKQRIFKDFLRHKSLPLSTMRSKNNWGNWGLVLSIATAAYLDNRELFTACVERWKEFIERQIEADGHLHHEVNRNEGRSGIWYTHFSLLPQTIAAEIAHVNGVDVYDYSSPGGHTLRSAFERAAEWSKNPGSFPYFSGDPKKLGGVRYISYFEILNARWPNPSASASLKEFRPLTARHAAPCLTFTHGLPARDP